MKQKKNKNTSECSIKSIIPDFINFFLILLIGMSFDWNANEISSMLLIQIGSMAVFLLISLCGNIFYSKFKLNINPNKFAIFFSCLGLLALSINSFLFSIALLEETTVKIFNFIYVPFTLFSYRHFFIKNLTTPISIEAPIKYFIGSIATCWVNMIIYVLPHILENISFSNTQIFILCYSLFCFPYQKTFDLLFSAKTKKNLYCFITKPAKMMGLSFIVASILVALLYCGNPNLEIMWIVMSIWFFVGGLFVCIVG